MPNCPICQKPLEPVRQSPYSPLNSDQFDASKAGDWFCDCSSNGRGHASLAYFWDKEVIDPCRQCKGTGKVKARYAFMEMDGGDPVDVPCPRCQSRP